MNTLFQSSRSSDQVLMENAILRAKETMHRRVMSTAKISLMLVNLYSDHWYWLVIYPGPKRIDCLNWLPTSSNTIKVLCRLMHVYLFAHSTEDTGFEFNASEWSFCVVSRRRCPQQLNGYDCGAFACRAAERLVAGQLLDFTQETMLDFRYKHLLSLKMQDNRHLSHPGVPLDVQGALQALTNFVPLTGGAAVELDAIPDEVMAQQRRAREETRKNPDGDEALQDAPEYY